MGRSSSIYSLRVVVELPYSLCQEVTIGVRLAVEQSQVGLPVGIGLSHPMVDLGLGLGPFLGWDWWLHGTVPTQTPLGTIGTTWLDPNLACSFSCSCQCLCQPWLVLHGFVLSHFGVPWMLIVPFLDCNFWNKIVTLCASLSLSFSHFVSSILL